MSTSSITQKIAYNAQAIEKQIITQKAPQKTELNMDITALTALASEQNVRVNGSDRRQFGYSFNPEAGTDTTVASINKTYDTTKATITTGTQQVYGTTVDYTVEVASETEQPAPSESSESSI